MCGGPNDPIYTNCIGKDWVLEMTGPNTQSHMYKLH